MTFLTCVPLIILSCVHYTYRAYISLAKSLIDECPFGEFGVGVA